MNIHGLPSPPPGLAQPSVDLRQATDRSGSFLSLLGEQLDQINQQHHLADRQIQQLALGQTDAVHDVVLSVAKADLMFRMVLEIRNRLIESYQEVMRMQV
jgi:flagellar hook-basal body complex protein FliE